MIFRMESRAGGGMGKGGVWKVRGKCIKEQRIVPGVETGSELELTKRVRGSEEVVRGPAQEARLGVAGRPPKDPSWVQSCWRGRAEGVREERPTPKVRSVTAGLEYSKANRIRAGGQGLGASSLAMQALGREQGVGPHLLPTRPGQQNPSTNAPVKGKEVLL